MINWNIALIKFSILEASSQIELAEADSAEDLQREIQSALFRHLSFSPDNKSFGPSQRQSSLFLPGIFLSAVSTIHIMRFLSCNSDPCSLLLWAGTCCCRCWWWTSEPEPQGTIRSIGANKELLPWLEGIRSHWEGINSWCEWDFPGLLFLPGPQELSKQFFPEYLAAALTKDVQSALFLLGSRNHNLRMCPSGLTKSYP